MAAALFCFVKKRKEKTIEETEIIHIDEHRKIKEAIVEGPHGSCQTVVLSVEDDIHVNEEIIRSEKIEEKGLHRTHEAGDPSTIEEPQPPSSTHHHLHQKHS